MTHRLITLKSGKPILGGHGIRASATRALKDHAGVSLNEHVGAPLNEHVGIPISKAVSMSSCGAVNDMGIPVHIVTKKEIEEELARTEELYGMTTDKFYRAWKNGEIHDFHAMILGNLYESYRQRYK